MVHASEYVQEPFPFRCSGLAWQHGPVQIRPPEVSWRNSFQVPLPLLRSRAHAVVLSLIECVWFFRKVHLLELRHQRSPRPFNLHCSDLPVSSTFMTPTVLQKFVALFQLHHIVLLITKFLHASCYCVPQTPGVAVADFVIFPPRWM